MIENIQWVLSILGALAVAAWAGWAKGKRSARVDYQNKNLKEYGNARKRMDEIGRMSDADAARDWLRDRGK